MTSRRRLFSALVVSGLGAATAVLLILGPPPQLVFSERALRDYDAIVNADKFAGPHVGFGGVTPEVVHALRRLEASPNGSVAFKYALVQGTMPGKLYALIGLKRTNPLLFKIVVQPFRLSPGYTSTFFGCILGGERTRHIVAAPGPNRVRLRARETLEDWWLRTRPNGEVHVDIIGGGYTSMFFDPPKKRNAA